MALKVGTAELLLGHGLDWEEGEEPGALRQREGALYIVELLVMMTGCTGGAIDGGGASLDTAVTTGGGGIN